MLKIDTPMIKFNMLGQHAITSLRRTGSNPRLISKLSIFLCTAYLSISLPAVFATTTSFPENAPQKELKQTTELELTLETTQPAHVFAHLQTYHANLKHLSHRMGQPMHQSALFKVSQIKPHEVIFQAHALHKKTERLAHQIGLEPISTKHPLDWSELKNTRPYHVLQEIDKALTLILQINKRLDIPPYHGKPTAPTDTTPSDVYQLASVVHRHLNELFLSPLSNSDVYALATQASHLCADLMPSSSLDNNIYPTPNLKIDFVDNQMVFKSIFNLLSMTKEKFNDQEAPKVKLLLPDPAAATHLGQIKPSDNYDALQLLLAELTYWHNQKSSDPILPIYYSGIKFPQDTLSRLAMIELQLERL